MAEVYSVVRSPVTTPGSTRSRPRSCGRKLDRLDDYIDGRNAVAAYRNASATSAGREASSCRPPNAGKPRLLRVRGSYHRRRDHIIEALKEHDIALNISYRGRCTR